MAGNWWSKTGRFTDMNVKENKYELMCNLYPRVLCVIDCSVVILEGGLIYGGKFLASEDYGDKISFKSSFQIFKIEYFYLICSWSQNL